MKPDYVFAYGFLGQALRGLNRNDEALAALKQAVHIDPKTAAFHGVLGEIYLDLKDYRAAADEFDQAQRLKGSDRWTSGLDKSVDGMESEGEKLSFT